MVCNVRIMEVDMFKELLPIGSVVLLKGGIKKIMVTGIKPVSKDQFSIKQFLFDQMIKMNGTWPL